MELGGLFLRLAGFRMVVGNSVKRVLRSEWAILRLPTRLVHSGLFPRACTSGTRIYKYTQAEGLGMQFVEVEPPSAAARLSKY